MKQFKKTTWNGNFFLSKVASLESPTFLKKDCIKILDFAKVLAFPNSTESQINVSIKFNFDCNSTLAGIYLFKVNSGKNT